MAKTMSEAILDTKSAIANKLLQDDGTITDITGKEVVSADEGYNSKPALPNKFLNPDGTYSTLNEIIASMVDTSIFIIVDELPATGDPQKIYLVPDGEGGFIEYHWMGDKWDAIGVIEIDLSNYPTLQDMANAIEEAAITTLTSSKAYTDLKIAGIDIVYEWDGQDSRTNPDNLELWSNILRKASTQTVLVKGPNCMFAIHQNQNEPLTNTYYSMLNRSVNLEDGEEGYEYISVQITTSDNNFTVSNVSGMIVYTKYPVDKQAVADNVKPEVIYYDTRFRHSLTEEDRDFWTEVYNINKKNSILIFYDMNSPAILLPVNTIRATGSQYITASYIFNKETSVYESYTNANRSFNTGFNITMANGICTDVYMSRDGGWSGIFYLDPRQSYAVPFIPTSPGHPATKKYVDDSITNNITNVLGGEY